METACVLKNHIKKNQEKKEIENRSRKEGKIIGTIITVEKFNQGILFRIRQQNTNDSSSKRQPRKKFRGSLDK